jgi:phosphoglycolate phosphatase
MEWSMNCKLVIFDFDGTLANSFPFVLAMLDELAEKFNTRKMNREDLPKLRHYSPHKIMKMHKVRIWKVPGILKYTRVLMRRDAHRIAKFEGIDELIRELSLRKIKLGIVTTNTRAIVEQVLGEDIFRLFNYFLGDVSLFGKPKALKKMLTLAGCENSETLAIGDELRDLDAAAKVKIPFGAVSWGFSSPEALSARNPLFTFTYPAQILESIDSPLLA